MDQQPSKRKRDDSPPSSPSPSGAPKRHKHGDDVGPENLTQRVNRIYWECNDAQVAKRVSGKVPVHDVAIRFIESLDLRADRPFDRIADWGDGGGRLPSSDLPAVEWLNTQDNPACVNHVEFLPFRMARRVGEPPYTTCKERVKRSCPLCWRFVCPRCAVLPIGCRWCGHTIGVCGFCVIACPRLACYACDPYMAACLRIYQTAQELFLELHGVVSRFYSDNVYEVCSGGWEALVSCINKANRLVCKARFISHGDGRQPQQYGRIVMTCLPVAMLLPALTHQPLPTPPTTPLERLARNSLFEPRLLREIERFLGE